MVVSGLNLASDQIESYQRIHAKPGTFSMSKFKLLAKALRSDPLRTLVRLTRAKDEHASLLARFDEMLDQELLEDAKLVTDRQTMLERMPKDAVVAEIGVAEGEFSRDILRTCKPNVLHLVDPWNSDTDVRYSNTSYEKLKVTLSDEIKDGRVELHRGLSNDVLPELPEDYFDWVYLDAGHDYSSVREDLRLCKRVVKSRGLIAGHDYIRWVSPTDRYGVIEAVHEFVMETRSPFRFLTNQFDKHDSFAIVLNK